MKSSERQDVLASPYRGIHPFRYVDQAYFFGREETVAELLAKVLVSRLVLLFGESGTGKSSLINAGLIPALEKEGLSPERLRVRPIPDESILIERIQTGDEDGGRFLPSIFADDKPAETDTESQVVPCSLERFLKTTRDTDAYPALIFDQFEELFTLFAQDRDKAVGEEALQADLLDVIFQIVSNESLKVKVIIVIREDFFGKLEVLAKNHPQVFDYRVRLGHLDQNSARKAILGPFENTNPFPSRLIPNLADRIIQDLSDSQPNVRIRPTQLQIICSRLWEEYVPTRSELTIKEFEELGGVKGIIEGFLESELAGVEPVLRSQAVMILGNLITESGNRDVVSVDKLRGLIAKDIDGDELSSILGFLEERRLINRTHQRGTYYYELANEYLIQPIRREMQQLALEQERIEAEKELALAQKRAKAEKELALAQERAKAEREQRTNLQFALVLSAVLIVAALVLLYWQMTEAMIEKEARIEFVSSILKNLDPAYDVPSDIALTLTASDVSSIVDNYQARLTGSMGGEEEEEEEEEARTPKSLRELVEATYWLRLLKNNTEFVSEPLDLRRFQRISSHEHYRAGGDIGAYFTAMGTLGIQKAVFFPTGLSPDNYGYRDNMEELLSLQALYPKQIIAFCTVNEGDTEAPAVFQDCLKKGGRGLKLIGGHPDFYEPENPLDSPTMMRVYEVADRQHVPVVIHINMVKFPELRSQFEHVLQTFPDVSFVAAHYCKDDPPFELCAQLLDTYDNLYTDLSMGGALDRYLADISIHRDDYRNFILQYEDRILWGADLIIDDPRTKTADFIHRRISYDLYLLETGSAYDPAMEETFQDIPEGAFALEDVQLFGLDLPEETLTKIYEDNPRRVLNLSD